MKPLRMRSKRSAGLAVTRLSGEGPSEGGPLSASMLAASVEPELPAAPSATCAGTAPASAASALGATEAPESASGAPGAPAGFAGLAEAAIGPLVGREVVRETCTGGARVGPAGRCAQPLSSARQAAPRASRTAGGGSGIDFARLNLHPAAGFVTWYG